MFNNPNFIVGYIDQSRFDIAKKDGWKLLYNWFPTNTDVDCQVPAMLFYNQYRGTMKLFYFHMSGLNTSGNVMASLFTDRENTLFNYNQLIIDQHSSKNKASIVSQSATIDPSSSTLGLVTNHWYAFEWNVSCYDPNIKPGDFMTMNGWAAHLENIDLSGAITGDASGSITTVANSSDFNSIVSTKDLTKTSTKLISGAVTNVVGDDIGKFFSTKAEKANNRFLKNALTNLSKQAPSAIASAIAGPIGGFLGNGVSRLLGKIFPGKKSSTQSTQAMKLKIKLAQKLEGTLSDNLPFGNVQFQLPSTPANEQSYAGRLGVFQIKSKPIIKVTGEVSQIINGDKRLLQGVMMISKANDIININPDLLEVANVEIAIRPIFCALPRTMLPNGFYPELEASFTPYPMYGGVIFHENNQYFTSLARGMYF